MCLNAAENDQNRAKERWMQKDAAYRSDEVKFANKEPQAIRGMQRVATGYSRGVSDDYQKALYTQGQGRRAYEAGYIKYLQQKQTVDEGGKSRRRSTGKQAILRAKGALDAASRDQFGVQMQRRYRGRLLQMQTQQAKIVSNLGLPKEYGAPVMMPGSDYLSGALSIASNVASIYSAFNEG